MPLKWIGILFAILATGHCSLYDSNSDVIELTSANFNYKVIDSDAVWLVEFYAPWCGHCKNLAPEWAKAATALKGIVKVGAVNMDEHGSLGGPYNVKGFPTIKVFGRDKTKPSDYQGARSAQGIVDEGLNQVKRLVQSRLGGGGGGSSRGGGGGSGSAGDSKGFEADDVIELTDSNFEEEVLESEDMWIVAFHAPWCGHCKNLAPHWARAARELKDKVKIGAVDATAHQVYSSRYGVKGFPTIKMFPTGKKDGPMDYDGGRTADDIISWANDKLALNLPPPEVVQVTSQEVLRENCEKHPLCIVSVLPHILDCQSECRNKYIDTLRELGNRYKRQMWGWVWAEAAAQPNLEEALGIGGFGYPAMAAVNARKMKYAILKGAFSETGIHEFLRELSVGRGSTAPVKGATLPTIESTEPWDGKDGELPAEDDIDLSDVELDDLDDTKEKDEL